MLELSQCLSLQLGKGSEGNTLHRSQEGLPLDLVRSKPGGHCLEHTFHNKRRGQDAKGKSELWTWSSWAL